LVDEPTPLEVKNDWKGDTVGELSLSGVGFSYAAGHLKIASRVCTCPGACPLGILATYGLSM